MRNFIAIALLSLVMAQGASANTYVWAVTGTEPSGSQLLAAYSLTGTDSANHPKTLNDTVLVTTNTPTVTDVQNALGLDGVAAEQAAMDAWLAKLYPGN